MEITEYLPVDFRTQMEAETLCGAEEIRLRVAPGTHCVGACELDGKPLGGKDPALLDKLQKAYQQWFDEKTAK